MFILYKLFAVLILAACQRFLMSTCQDLSMKPLKAIRPTLPAGQQMIDFTSAYMQPLDVLYGMEYFLVQGLSQWELTSP